MSELTAKRTTPLSSLNEIIKKWEVIISDQPLLLKDLRDWRDRYLHVFKARHRIDPMMFRLETNSLKVKTEVLDAMMHKLIEGLLSITEITESEDDFGYAVSARVFVLSDEPNRQIIFRRSEWTKAQEAEK